MESVAKLMTENLQDLILLGFGSGSLLAVIAILTGFSIKQALSFFDK